MYSVITDDETGGGYVVSLTTGIRTSITAASHVELLERVKNATIGTRILKVELDIVRGYLDLINPAPTATVGDIDYDLLAQKTAALVTFPTTLTIDPPPATGHLS